MEKTKLQEIDNISLNKLLDDAEVSVNDRKHLFRSLSSLVKAKDPTPSFKLYGKDDVATLFEMFITKSEYEDLDVPKGAYEYELTRLKKCGPQGGHPSWAEVEPLFELYASRPTDVRYVNTRIIDQICSNLKLCCGNLSPLTVDTALASLIASQKLLTTAAGCRCFGLKKTNPIAKRYALADWRSGLYKKFFMYTFERYNKNKVRLFMPGSFSNMLDQARFILPLMEKIQHSLRTQGAMSPMVEFADKVGVEPMYEIESQALHRALVDAFGTVALTKGWVKKHIKFLYVQGDFEKMDTTTGTSQYETFYCPPLETIFGKESGVRESMLYTTTQPIVSPTKIILGNHGTGSGMENTNNGEGFSNLYYGKEVLNQFSYYMRKHYSSVKYVVISHRVNGDDSKFDIAFYDIDDKVLNTIRGAFQRIAERVAAQCGFRINDKWRMSSDFGLYNQRIYWIDCNTLKYKQYYPIVLCLNSIVHPEKEYTKATWDKDYRDLDITEKVDNCSTFPAFQKFVDFVDNGMKFRLLGRSESETKRILSKYDRYRALQPYDHLFNRPDYNISTSASINYLLNKRHIMGS